MHHSLGDDLPVRELHTSPPNNSVKYCYLPFSLVAAALGWEAGWVLNRSFIAAAPRSAGCCP